MGNNTKKSIGNILLWAVSIVTPGVIMFHFWPIIIVWVVGAFFIGWAVWAVFGLQIGLGWFLLGTYALMVIIIRVAVYVKRREF